MNLRWFKSGLSIVLASLLVQGLVAQERSLGTWRSYLPYGYSLGAFDAGDKVYSLAEKTVFSYEKSTGTIQIYDKVNGLSDVTIKTGNYDPATKALVVAYTNSNLDIIYNGTDIYNIPDFKNQNTVSSVAVNGISFHNGNAFISSDIGISVIDLDRKEISNTYIIGSTGGQIKVFATTADATNIYAATAEGVKHASLASSNLQNFNNWSLYDSTQGLPKKKASFIAAYNNKVYAVVGTAACDSLFEFDGVSWSRIFYEPSSVFLSLGVVNNALYFTTSNTSNFSARLGKIDAAGVQTVTVAPQALPHEWFEANGIAWESYGEYGLVKNQSGNRERIMPDGPYSSSVYDLNVWQNTLYVAPGSVDDSWGGQYNGQGFFSFEDEKWKVTSRNTYGPMADYYDILSTTNSLDGSKTYAGSYLSGLIEINNTTGQITLYDKNNSALEEVQGDTQRTKVSCLTTDQYGNVWIGNSGANKAIKMIPADGSAWKAYVVPFFFQTMKKILIDQSGQLWAPVRRSGEGLLVWSNNNTPDDPSDDASRILSTGAGTGGLPDPLVFCVAEDKEGNIWAGTSQGIGIFYCPGSVLTSNGCDADQIKVERDGYIGYLFGTESVRAIAVDAANRKWIGTTKGLWLISADGKTELLRFTTDNSPLPSNQITDIAINENTGEVFIGTLAGLVSYQGDAMSKCTDCKEALVYPNPVKPEYDGPIAIKGLTENAYVKITDISGTLVYQGRANGSQMVWNGKGYNGKRASSGVYLVFSSTDLGKERRVAKILLSN
ncbi:MAG TPA: two-component regulator propeller domain-containing protein [Chitinophagales bacterium]|nr:two-component regulator propeller domain-containing protein [Chitinophagales bacterium]